jgi:predicted nucleic acid-binding protein
MGQMLIRRLDDAVVAAPIARDVAMGAARLRAASRMKPPDAIHVATAEVAGCADFVSADRGLRLPGGMRPVVWDRLPDPPPGTTP